MKPLALLDLADDPGHNDLLVEQLAAYAHQQYEQRERQWWRKVGRTLARVDATKKELTQAFQLGKTIGELSLDVAHMNPKALKDALELAEAVDDARKEILASRRYAVAHTGYQRRLNEAPTADRQEELIRRHEAFLDGAAIHYGHEANAAGRAAAGEEIASWVEEYAPELRAMASPRPGTQRPRVDAGHLVRQLDREGDVYDALNRTAAELGELLGTVERHALRPNHTPFGADPRESVRMVEQMVGMLGALNESFRGLATEQIEVLQQVESLPVAEQLLIAGELRTRTQELGYAAAGLGELVKPFLRDERVLEVTSRDPHYANAQESFELADRLSHLGERELRDMVEVLAAHDRRLSSWELALRDQVIEQELIPELEPLEPKQLTGRDRPQLSAATEATADLVALARRARGQAEQSVEIELL